MNAALAGLLEPGNPLVGGLPSNAEAFGQHADGVVVQPIVFEEPLSLFSHGNTFPRHRRYLPLRNCYSCP